MEAVRRREEEIGKMWAEWERETRAEMARAVDERMAWVTERTEEIELERARLDGVKEELERKMEQLEERDRRASVGQACTGRYTHGGKTPLEEVKNILAPLSRLAHSPDGEQTPVKRSRMSKPPEFVTPMNRAAPPTDYPSAMKGVILTETGETLATPNPSEFAKLFEDTPKVALNFAQIFEYDSEAEDSGDDVSYETNKAIERAASSAAVMLSASGSKGGVKEKAHVLQPIEVDSDTDLDEDDAECTPRQVQAKPPMRLRRPSIRSASGSRPQNLMESAIHIPTATATVTSSSSRARSKSRPRPASSASSSRPTSTVPPPPQDPPRIEYDLSDEENLPSPFLKKVERERITRTTSVPVHVVAAEQHAAPRGRTAPRKSANLRAVAVVNAANAVGGTVSSRSGGNLARAAAGQSRTVSTTAVSVRSSIAKAQRASEDARKALFRP